MLQMTKKYMGKYLKFEIVLWKLLLFHWTVIVNTLIPSEAYHMCQWAGSSLVKIVACGLLGDKPLPDPILNYCKLDL